MLNRYIKINGEQIPNPVNYSEEFRKISNAFQSEAGDDIVIDVRCGKYSGSMKFKVSSKWKDKLKTYANMPSVILTVDKQEYTVRMESISCDLESNSERCRETQGYWNVSFDVEEL